MRRLSNISAIALAAALLAPPAFAQTSAPAPAPAPAAPADPVLATVNNLPIHMSDVQNAAANLPAQMQQLPPDQLFPLLVNQLIDRKALLVAAEAENLQNDPQVAAVMADAADEKLENAYIQQQVVPLVTDADVQAEYKKDYAGKPGPAQVDARHILVKTQAEAESIITQLNHGANFAKLAEKYSIDPGASNGGELGWFTQDQMVPVFANAAFALKPGEYTKTPVQSQFGWHVILCEGKRTAPPQSFDDVKDQIRQNLTDDAIKATLADARSKVTIQTFNPDGSPAGSGAGSGGGSGGNSGNGSGGGVHINLNPNQ
jgi:peptidyl-prolyl cis-trans isomerase C